MANPINIAGGGGELAGSTLHKLGNTDAQTAQRFESNLKPSGSNPAREVVLDVAQLTLDVAGIFDPTPTSDTLSGLMSLGRGRFVDALISGVSAVVPYAGDLAKVGKLGRLADTVSSATELLKRAPEMAEQLKPALTKLDDLIRSVPTDKLPGFLKEPLEKVKGKLDEFFKTEAKQADSLASRSPDVDGTAKADGPSGPKKSPPILPRQVEYGSTELSQQAMKFRQAEGLYSGRNVAVFEYVDAAGETKTLAMASERGAGHAERLIAKKLDDMGISPEQVKGIYSELEPCSVPGGYCKKFLAEKFPQADKSYSFEYGDKDSRKRGVQALKDAVQGLKP